MSLLSIFPSLTVGRLAAFAAFAFALAATGAGAAEISFVKGKFEAKGFKGTDYCRFMYFEDFNATKARVSGSWRIIAPGKHTASGSFDVFTKKDKIVADMWGSDVQSSIETTKQIGQNLHVNVKLFVEIDEGSKIGAGDITYCEVAFVLPGIIVN